jgi:hypothetical protein
MKKTVLLTIVAMLALGTVNSYGQQTFRPKYNNLSFSKQKLTVDGVKSDIRGFGGAYTTGRSYIVHPNPIAGMLRFGIDATWFDLNYVNYDYDIPLVGKFNRHQLEVAVGIGASAHVNPVSLLGVHAYFRFMPTLSGMFDRHDALEDTSIYGGYASFFVAGGAVSWGMISLGAEARWGSGKYHLLNNDEEEGLVHARPAIKTTGMRVYVGLRF